MALLPDFTSKTVNDFKNWCTLKNLSAKRAIPKTSGDDTLRAWASESLEAKIKRNGHGSEAGSEVSADAIVSTVLHVYVLPSLSSQIRVPYLINKAIAAGVTVSFTEGGEDIKPIRAIYPIESYESHSAGDEVYEGDIVDVVLDDNGIGDD